MTAPRILNDRDRDNLLVSCTDAERLNAHWQGFCATDAARAALTTAYIEKIGYDPFADDPTINPEAVRRTLAEWDAAASAQPTDDREYDCRNG